MPSLGSGYTFADFLLRLQRSPAAHMAPLYHAHKELFVHRPDMFTKTVMAVTWEKAVALVKTAYYTQPVEAETYRAVLARMLLHNRHVQQRGAGQLVDWRAALEVYSEAVLAHGTALPTRLTTSTLRLLAAHRQWQRSLRLLEVAEVNDQLTKPMLIDAAHACATPAAWQVALGLLTDLHAQDPALLTDSIRSLRPEGTDALSVASASHSLLPTTSSSSSAEPLVAQQQQRHLLHVLNDVVSAVPGSVVLQNELCFSYLTHLVASTTLPPEQKSRMLATAIQSLQWQQALELLMTFAEPNLLTDAEWDAAMTSSPQLLGDGSEATPQKGKLKKKKRRNKSKSKDKDAATLAELESSTETPGKDGSAKDDGECENGGAPPSTATARASTVSSAVVSSVPGVVELVPLLRDRMRWLQCAPGAVATLLAALVSKLPADTAADFVREYLRADSLHLPSSSSSTGGASDVAADTEFNPTAALAATRGPSAGRHPVVIQALLRTCAATPDGWATAVPLLLEQSAAHAPTPTDVLSELVLAMRAARESALVVKLLNDHIVPSGSQLTPAAVEALLECVLAHNRACHMTILKELDDHDTDKRGDDEEAARWRAIQSVRSQTVHWRSALGWATSLQADTTERRIARTGTGPSAGAESRTALERVEETPPLSPVMLNLLLCICVDADQPLAALRAMGSARDANKLELQFSEQIRALLYCVLYERPFEAVALVEQAEKSAGERAAKPLRQLLHLAQLSKEREAGLRELAARVQEDSQI